MLEEALRLALRSSSHPEELLQVMTYAVFPAGKLFRPKLVEAIARDLTGEVSPNHLHLAAALELHHAYTLVHDDLPAMDNDLIRRGKPSTHAAFGEWKAILAGDALLIASFGELMKIDHRQAKKIHQLMTWATGAKGLIKGQFMDLESDGQVEFKKVVHIHELKTARLIQLATLGAAYLSKEDLRLPEVKDFLRIGRDLGVSFQLLDDVTELAMENVSEHEKKINPFIVSVAPALEELIRSHRRLAATVKKMNLRHLGSMLEAYFEANRKTLRENFKLVEKHCGDREELQRLRSWITTDV